MVRFIDANAKQNHPTRSGETSPGLQDASKRFAQLMIFEWATDHLGGQVPARVTSWRRETLVHELGHVFGMGDFGAVAPWPRHSPAHQNWRNDDGCVMLYGIPPPTVNDFENDNAHFGPPPGPGDPADLRIHIAGHVDPLAGPPPAP